MVPASHLRIYRRIDASSLEERDLDGTGLRRSEGAGWRHLDFGGHSLGILKRSDRAPALVKEIGGVKYFCPQGTRVQTLVGLLTARANFPLEVADAIVPEDAAALAAVELEKMGVEQPSLRAYMVTAPWHVPLRWFIAFDDEERSVVESPSGVGITYLTGVSRAVERVVRGTEILERSDLADVVVDPVRELLGWLHEFDGDSFLELDYGEVSALFPPEELVLDHSAAEVWACLTALEAGDWEESGRRYSQLAEWWGRARGVGNAN